MNGKTNKKMDWKVIFGLSLFGLAMAIGTVFAISPRVEPIFWLVIFIICAFVIARQAAGRPFLHGLLLGILNSVWITGAHLIFFNRYLAAHPQEAAMMSRVPTSMSPKAIMALTGPVIGVISGIVIGVLAWVVTKVLSASSSQARGRAQKARIGPR